MKFPITLDRQKEIYLNGFAGIPPVVPVSFRELEEAARKKLSSQAYAYIAGGAGNEGTLRSNTQSFEKYKIVPRMLRDVSLRDTSIELFGQKLSSPLLLCPIGVLELAHRQADVGVAKAAASVNVPYIFSSQASRSMEEVSSVMGNTPRWFQLYWSKSNELVKSFVQRAEKCNCSAIVVTLDTTMLGWRTRDLDMAYLPFLEGRGIAQYTSDPVFQELMNEAELRAKRKITFHSVVGLIQMTKNYIGGNFLSKIASGRPIKAVQKFINIYSNPALTWNELKYLREITKLPVLLKGILHADDARKAIDFGMDGIIVSNHGGRQVDGSISTIDALPSVADAIQDKIPVLMDSGIRGGADIFKALALGAKAVCIGRPYVYGLAVGAEQGVKEVLQNMRTDFELTMGLAGCASISEITKSNLSL
ncbi:MAG: alpha-hydroxy-acid oxidizing protein [Bacteroidetes bacterium]|nr:alpha-hydroxy-acid oxidizing protein [Bacteroidota bacterium]MBI3482092.1 alpha-hydroxy-acid oxidizing protein [Bacteroidota bacterium]